MHCKKNLKKDVDTKIYFCKSYKLFRYTFLSVKIFHLKKTEEKEHYFNSVQSGAYELRNKEAGQEKSEGGREER